MLEKDESLILEQHYLELNITLNLIGSSTLTVEKLAELSG